MMIVRFDPQHEFRRFFGSDSAPSQQSSVAFDAVRRDGELELRFDLPGFRVEDLDVAVDDNVVKLTASRTTEIAEDEEMVRRGRWHGSLTRSLRLGDDVDGDAVQATFDAGVLALKFALRQVPTPKKVEISSAIHAAVTDSAAA